MYRINRTYKLVDYSFIFAFCNTKIILRGCWESEKVIKRHHTRKLHCILQHAVNEQRIEKTC